MDMRAEVGLKTRYIHITSEVSEGNSNGGHIKVSELNVHVIDHGPAKKSSKESTAIEGGSLLKKPLN